MRCGPIKSSSLTPSTRKTTTLPDSSGSTPTSRNLRATWCIVLGSSTFWQKLFQGRRSGPLPTRVLVKTPSSTPSQAEVQDAGSLLAAAMPTAGPLVDWAAWATTQANCKETQALLQQPGSLQLSFIQLGSHWVGVNAQEATCGLWYRWTGENAFSRVCTIWPTRESGHLGRFSPLYMCGEGC